MSKARISQHNPPSAPSAIALRAQDGPPADHRSDTLGTSGRWIYALGLGSNRAHGRHGRPADVLRAAEDAIDARILARSSIIETAPLGPGGRRYANAALLIETALAPAALLSHLKSIERRFGRRPGRRWGARVLDLDILLWSGGAVRARNLAIPHPALAHRRFVLDPLMTIAPEWRVPGFRANVRQLHARLTRAKPIHR